MIPQGTPVATSSALRQASASARGPGCQPEASHSAVATATSSAALEDSPAPTGTSEASTA